MSTQRKPVNYLNNADLLREIHASKRTYCAYLDGMYDYDAIVHAVDVPPSDWPSLITPDVLELAIKTRAARLNTTEVEPSELVFRMMTWEHIPLVPTPPSKSAKKTLAQQTFEQSEEEIATEEVVKEQRARVNFPPFQQIRLTPESVEVVAKSHWRGDLDGGMFCSDHGTLTNALAKMFITLCQRYASKYNFRGYSYNDELVGSAILQLTYVGLRFNEAKSANPFAFFTTVMSNAFKRVLVIEKKSQTIRDDLMEMSNLNPSWSRTNIFSEE